MRWVRRLVALLAIGAAGTAAYALIGRDEGTPSVRASATPAPLPTAGPGSLGGSGTAPAPRGVRRDARGAGGAGELRPPPGAGPLFDHDTGGVGGGRHP